MRSLLLFLVARPVRGRGRFQCLTHVCLERWVVAQLALTKGTLPKTLTTNDERRSFWALSAKREKSRKKKKKKKILKSLSLLFAPTLSLSLSLTLSHSLTLLCSHSSARSMTQTGRFYTVLLPVIQQTHCTLALPAGLLAPGLHPTFIHSALNTLHQSFNLRSCSDVAPVQNALLRKRSSLTCA